MNKLEWWFISWQTPDTKKFLQRTKLFQLAEKKIKLTMKTAWKFSYQISNFLFLRASYHSNRAGRNQKQVRIWRQVEVFLSDDSAHFSPDWRQKAVDAKVASWRLSRVEFFLLIRWFKFSSFSAKCYADFFIFLFSKIQDVLVLSK